MQCQFEQLRKGNVHVKCFNQALYHVQSAKPELQNYCALHIQRLPRNTKLELLFDVIELPPSEIPSLTLLPCNSNNETENDNTVQSSAGSIASKSGLNSDVHLMNATSSKSEARDLTYLNDPNAKVGVIACKKTFARPFRNLGELCECYGYLPRPKTWRMLPFAVPGEINGLHKTRGFALATNGIHVAIENSECVELFIGHLEWFIIDDLNAPAGSLATLNNAAKDTISVVRNQLKQFDELFEL